MVNNLRTVFGIFQMQILAQAGCVSHAWAMRSLAIVITIVQSPPLLSFSLRLLLLTHFGEFTVYENLFPQIFWQN